MYLTPLELFQIIYNHLFFAFYYEVAFNILYLNVTYDVIPDVYCCASKVNNKVVLILLLFHSFPSLLFSFPSLYSSFFSFHLFSFLYGFCFLTLVLDFILFSSLTRLYFSFFIPSSPIISFFLFLLPWFSFLFLLNSSYSFPFLLLLLLSRPFSFLTHIWS